MNRLFVSNEVVADIIWLHKQRKNRVYASNFSVDLNGIVICKNDDAVAFTGLTLNAPDAQN